MSETDWSDAAYEIGYDAYMLEGKEAKNPYEEGTSQHYCWYEGWYQAHLVCDYVY